MAREHVASYAEAWIEIGYIPDVQTVAKSPPTQRRGLKWDLFGVTKDCKVASYAEAWVEISDRTLHSDPGRVASCMEAWIEITEAHTNPATLTGRLLHGGVD